jgi:hypothetical protein
VETASGRRLRAKLDPSVVLAEGMYRGHPLCRRPTPRAPPLTYPATGYKEYVTGRNHMARMGDRHKNKDEEIELDGIGGVNIIVKADVHRSGINFPAYAFENQAETEGFARMAKRAGYEVYGLPNYVVWHIDTEEKSGNA